MHKLAKQFSFAGFDFPRYIVNVVPRAPLARRLWDFKTSPKTARNMTETGYYTAPTPNNTEGIGFYHSDESGCSFRLRWQWANEVPGVGGSLSNNLGYWTDEHRDKIRGLVLRLPNQRGFLAAWSMGEGMCAELDFKVFDSDIDAAYAADNMAECAAEHERDYQEQAQREQDAEEAEQENEEAGYWASRDVMTEGE